MKPIRILFRRGAAIGLLLTAMGTAWFLAGQPLVSRIGEYDVAIADTRDRLERTLRVAAQRPGLAARRDALQRRISAKSGFLNGASGDLAAARIQDRVKRVVAASGGALKSTQALRADDRMGFPRIAVRVTMTADTEALQRVIHALESATPILLLDNIDIRSGRNRGKNAGGLQVRFDVYGFMRRSDP